MPTKILTIISIALIILCSCNPALKKANKDKTNTENQNKTNQMNTNKDNQTDPVWVVNQIFIAAKEGKYELLLDLCDPEGKGDGDTKTLCTIQSASAESKQEFDDYFKLGKIVGEPVIEGEEAKVQFKFGPDGDKDETMNLIKRGEKWYLSSF